MLRQSTLVINCKFLLRFSTHRENVYQINIFSSLVDEPKTNANVADDLQAHVVRDLCDKIAYAFQLATGQGPLCQEPMQGIAVFLEDISVQASSNDELDMGRLTGDAIRLVREGISQGFLDWSPRVMLAMYSCEIQATSKPA